MKLIRDKIPEIIRNNGEECEITELSQTSFFYHIKKLDEEKEEFVTEVLLCDNEKMYEEAGDLIEVIISIIKKIDGNDYDEILNRLKVVMEKKRIERGSFEKNYILN